MLARVRELRDGLDKIMTDCSRYWWTQINGAIICTPIPNSLHGANETPLFLAANNLLSSRNQQTLHVNHSTVRAAGKVLELTYDVAFDLELHARYKNKTLLLTAGAMSLWSPRYDACIRKEIESLLLLP